MKLNMKEKKILYAYACPSHHNTVTRLKWLTALTVDPEAKSQMLHLARKIETETEERWYEAFYHHLRMEMDEYRRIRSQSACAESKTPIMRRNCMRKLSKYEKETIINGMRRTIASIYTFKCQA